MSSGGYQMRVKNPVKKYVPRVISIHTRNVELLSACVFTVGGISILVADLDTLKICDFFFGALRCYPTFLAFTLTDSVPIISALVLFGISGAFLTGALMGYRGHSIRALTTLAMGTMWLIVAVNMFRQLPLYLPFAWTFLGIGLLLVRGFGEQWIRRR